MPDALKNPTDPPRTVALFVTCLVDLLRPNIGFAAVKLLEDAGCRVIVPAAQTCCGQPTFNSGDFVTARAIATQVIAAFEGYDYIVVPSGSCGGMIATHYEDLFQDDPAWRDRAQALQNKSWELMRFLTEVCGVTRVTARYDGIATYHDSCAGLRELDIKDQPRRLLATVSGLAMRELADGEICCGFGGTFCVKYPDISNRMVGEKTAQIINTGADTLLAGDLGCLLNIAGKLSRDGVGIRVRHVAEVLAGEEFCGANATPPIGWRRQKSAAYKG